MDDHHGHDDRDNRDDRGHDDSDKDRDGLDDQQVTRQPSTSMADGSRKQLPLSATGAWERMEKILSQPMTGRKIQTQINEARDILDESPTGTKRKRYQTFLLEVLRKCGPAFVVLCAIGLGQAQIANMNAASRSSLLGILEKKMGLPLIGRLEDMVPARLKGAS